MKSRPTTQKKRPAPSKDPRKLSTAVPSVRSTPSIAEKPSPKALGSKERTKSSPIVVDRPTKQGSVARGTSIPQKLQATSMLSDCCVGSDDPYSPESGKGASFDSASVTPSTSSRSTFDQSQQYPNAFPDLGDIMFPSTDPFAYPNQPMMTLENQNLFIPENTHTFGTSDTIDTQFFNSLPPYLMQGPQSGFGFQPMGVSIGSSSLGDGKTMTMDSTAGPWPPEQQQNTPGPGGMPMNYSPFFGQGWMGQHYNQG